jgi:hydroxylamine reductase
MIELAMAAEGKKVGETTHKAVISGLFMTITNVNFNEKSINKQIDIIRKRKKNVFIMLLHMRLRRS